GVTVPVGVLARRVDVEAVVRVLDQGDLEAARGEARDELLDERRLAAAGPAGKTEGLHRVGKVFMRPPNLYQNHLAAGEGEHDREDATHQRVGEAPAA